MRGLKASLAVLAAVLLVLGLPASASASTPVATVAGGGVSAAGDWQYDPSGSKWREWMINVTGKVLGDSMPNSWRAEQLANQFRQGKGIPSGEALNQQFGYQNYSRNANGELVPLSKPGQGTYDDYVLDQYANGKGKGVTPPATRSQVFARTLGAAGALTFYPLGAQIGAAGFNTVAGWWGYDPNGVVCSMTREGGFWNDALAWASGQDCTMWRQTEDSINVDAVGGEFGPSVYNGQSLQFVVAFRKGTGSVTACYEEQGYTAAGQYNHGWYHVDGSVIGFALRNSSGSPGMGAQTLQVGYTGTSDAAVRLSICSAFGGNGILANVVPAFSGPGPYEIAFNRDGQWLGTPAWENPNVDPETGEPVSADPARTMSCTVTYTDGTTATASGEGYHESGGVIAPPPCPPTPQGKVPDSVAVDQATAGGAPAPGTGGVPSDVTVVAGGGAPAKQRVYDEEVTPGYKEWAEQFPECGTGACLLDLLVKSPTSDTYASCFDLLDGCVGWFEDAEKSSTYTCRYGIKEVELSECNLYANVFEPARVAVGAPYSDPMTGEWSGGSNATRPDQQAMGQAIRSPETTRGCDGMNVTGFDPVGFVMRPIQCALEWAFVPRPLVVEANFAGASVAWEGKPPAVIAEAVGSFALAPSASGCSKSVTLFGSTFNIIDACSGPMADVAHISTLVTSAGMVLLVIVVLKRQIAGMVGYNQGQG